MAIIYTDNNLRYFYVIERYTVGQQNWVKYKNTVGEEFTCLEEAFENRFKPQEQ